VLFTLFYFSVVKFWEWVDDRSEENGLNFGSVGFWLGLTHLLPAAMSYGVAKVCGIPNACSEHCITAIC